MNVKVQSRHVAIPRNAGAGLATRVQLVLARFSDSIARLELTLKDINGPRGGRDKVCVVRAQLVDGRQLVVIDRNASLRRAIGRALHRTKALIAGRLQRRRALLRTRGRRAALPQLEGSPA
ncbi:MAG TPA: hypothetical protein VIX81_03360 [Gammaproteobacteria bacterium]